MNCNFDNVIGFRPTVGQRHELNEICRVLGVRKSCLLRFILDDFIERYERRCECEKLG